MKKLLLIASISLFTLSATSKVTVIDQPINIESKLGLNPVLTDSFMDSVNIDTENESLDFVLKTTPKQDSAIVAQADVIVQAVGNVVPALKPYVSILGFLTTTIGYWIVHLKWRRKHKKELEEVNDNNG